MRRLFVLGVLAATGALSLAAAAYQQPAGQAAPKVVASPKKVAAKKAKKTANAKPTLATKPKPVEELRGLVYSETPKDERTDPNEAGYPWYRRTLPLAGVALAMVIVLNVIF